MQVKFMNSWALSLEKSISLYNLISDIEQSIKSAGTLIMDYFHKGSFSIVQKPGDQGVVTAADTASQDYLVTALSRIMPDAGILAEEGEHKAPNKEYCWVVDPLDGTTNFVHGMPYFCISVALTHLGNPVIGAVYNPILDEFFYACQGKGAFINGRPLQIIRNTLPESNLLISVPYVDEKYRQLVSDIPVMMAGKYSMRRCGAVALDLAQVAAGRMDGIFFTDLAWWDVAAGIVLIKEAGGIITDFSGQEVKEGYRSCVAGRPGVYEELIKLIGNKA
jgi:myo-inositol-1(or 4)-monophosphatase